MRDDHPTRAPRVLGFFCFLKMLWSFLFFFFCRFAIENEGYDKYGIIIVRLVAWEVGIVFLFL